MKKKLPNWTPGVIDVREKILEIERIFMLFEVLVGSWPCQVVRTMVPYKTSPEQMRLLIKMFPKKSQKSKFKTNTTQREIVTLFLSDKTVVDYNSHLQATRLYRYFIAWIQENKFMDPKRWSQKRFGACLADLGYHKRKNGIIYWDFIALRKEAIYGKNLNNYARN